MVHHPLLIDLLQMIMLMIIKNTFASSFLRDCLNIIIMQIAIIIPIILREREYVLRDSMVRVVLHAIMEPVKY